MEGNEVVLDVEGGSFVQRATDPVISPQPYVTPGDFDAQYPQPLDTREIIAMCEEVSLLRALPTEETALKAHLWRELNELAFTSGSSAISFADGECPAEYRHDGDNTSVNLKNVGAKKSLSYSDLKHARAVAAANWNGINELVGGLAAGEGLPGGSPAGTFDRAFVAGLKEKEVRLAGTLVMNGMDRLLVEGNRVSNSLEFDGIENWQANQSVSFHSNSNTASGTFSAQAFDRFLSESCAKPTVIAGHPQAIQEVMSAYFQLAWQGSQTVNVTSGDRIIPGFNFAGQVRTAVGTLGVIADANFALTDMGNGAYQAKIWAFRMTHNGVPLVFRIIQIPLGMTDLAPGCTAVSFQLWEKSALVIKHACAHGVYTSQFSGRTVTTCPTIY